MLQKAETLSIVKPGIYMSAKQKEPRVVLNESAPALIVDNRGDDYVIAFLGTGTSILVHKDCCKQA